MFEGYERSFVSAKVSPIFKTRMGKAIASKESKKYEFPEFENITDDLDLVALVLASEHKNLNADYFSRSELVQAVLSPIHKPFNIEHAVAEDESLISQPFFNRTKNTIVGHMIYSALANKKGEILSDKDIKELDLSDNPLRDNDECLDLVATAVLYNFMFPKTVADIQKTAAEGDMFVSMECWFKGYDFIIDGERVERTDANNEELTEKWSKGECGKDGKRICRALKDIVFGGVAATPTPANPESVFLATAGIESEIAHLVKRHDELHVLQSINPREEYISEHFAIEKSVAALKSKIKEVKDGK